MESAQLFLDAEQEGMLADIAESRDDLIECTDLRIGALADGTEGGKPSIVIAAVTPDGKPVVIQTTLALFLSAGDAFKARWGDPR